MRLPPVASPNHRGNSTSKIFGAHPAADIHHTYNDNTTKLEESIDSSIVAMLFIPDNVYALSFHIAVDPIQNTRPSKLGDSGNRPNR